MEKSRSFDLAGLTETLPQRPEDEAPLPLPRFGKEPVQVPAAIGALSWKDEEILGIRVFTREEQRPRGIEVNAFVEGLRPELLGMSAFVSIESEKGDSSSSLTITLDKPSEDKRTCSGSGSFGSADEIRKRLGELAILDVFLIE